MGKERIKFNKKKEGRHRGEDPRKKCDGRNQMLLIAEYGAPL